MRTFAINTLGCKVNQYESQQIRELLEQLGLNRRENADKADLVVINTCCVTHTASAKSRKYIRRAQKLSPGAVIIACGCLPSMQIDEFSIWNVKLTKNQIMYLYGGPDFEEYHPLTSAANLFPKVGDVGVYNPANIDNINFKDYAILAEHWLKEELFGD